MENPLNFDTWAEKKIMLATFDQEPIVENTIDTLIHDIINNKSVYPVFQPIIDLSTGHIHGYEALLRGPDGTSLHAPIPLFTAAAAVGRLYELENMARNKALEGFAQQQLPGKLFLNMSPNCLLDPKFRTGETLKLLEKYQIDPQKIVIEITEHQPIDDFKLLSSAVNHYRNMGFTVALDDLGEGNSSLRLWSEIKPNYVKLDKHFVTTLTEDDPRYNFVEIISRLAHTLGTKVIAEGIENERIISILHKFNIEFGQGYFFAKPVASPNKSPNWHPNLQANTQQPGIHRYARDLAKAEPTLQANTSLANTLEYFLAHPTIQAMAVLNKTEVLGIIERKTITDLFAGRFGRDLHSKKPVSTLVDKRSIVVAANTPLDVISQLITQRIDQNHHGIFAVVEQGEYLGIGYFIDLLKAITDVKINLAKAANPLTGLPGNQAIQTAIQKRLANNNQFVALYFDLDNFKPFNDTYGYELGDRVIIDVAKMLEQHTQADEFIGHIGGDDFICLWQTNQWQARLNNLFTDFNHHHAHWYPASAIEAKGFTGLDRQQKQQFFELLCLSVGAVVYAGDESFNFHHQLAEAASKAKKQAKAIPGNSVCTYASI